MAYKCPKCNKILTDYEVGSLYCVDCNKSYSSISELVSDGDNKSDSSIDDPPAGWRVATDDYMYEYKVVSVADERKGAANITKLNTVVSSYAEKGWRLTNVITNEIGYNASSTSVGIISMGTNATIDEILLFFERKLIRKNADEIDDSKSTDISPSTF